MAGDTISKTFTATGQSGSYAPFISNDSNKAGQFNVFLKSTAFIGTIQLERSPDGGTNWYTNGVWASGTFIQTNKYVFTGTEGNTSEIVVEGEVGTLYRLNCTAFTSGTLVTSMEGTR